MTVQPIKTPCAHEAARVDEELWMMQPQEMTVQPIKTSCAHEAARIDEAKMMMQPQDRYTYRDAMTGQPLNLELTAVARKMFDEIEAVQAQ